MNKIAAHLLKLRCSKFHTSPKRFDGKNLSKPSTETPPKVESVTGEIGKVYITPNGLDKFILLWAKKYKSKAEIPIQVPGSVYNHARNVVRIKFANYTILLVLIGCIYNVYTGKQEAKKGNTLQKKSLEWHEELKREHEREMQEKAAAVVGNK